MKKISDVLNVFNILDGAGNSPLFSSIGLEELNVLLAVNYGDRLLTNKAVENFEMVATAFMIQYQNKLDYLEQAINVKYDILQGKGKKVVEVVNANENKKNIIDEKNLQGSFDGGEMFPDSGRSSDNLDDLQKDLNREVSESLTGLNVMFDNLLLIDKHNIMNVIVKDVANYISLSIY